MSRATGGKRRKKPATPSARSGLGVGLIGFGYMGRTHLAAYRAAATAGYPNRIVALCDRDFERFQGRAAFQAGNMEKKGPFLDVQGLRTSSEPDELLSDPEVELVSICTPTDTHVALACRALAAGKHVLLEKPVALTARAVEKVAAAARKAGRVCMPAMCMRFWPGWSWLREAVAAREYGRVRSAVFRRLGSPPAWSQAFYSDVEKSGGALFDLHVHDADFVRFCFGAPASVVSTGTSDHVTTLYRYPGGPEHVVAEGGWNHAPGFPFFMGFTVVFERATADYALGRTPLLTLASDGKSREIVLPAGTGYDGEVRHVLAVLAGREKARATIGEAAELVAMLAAEKKSLATGRPVKL